MSYRIMKRLAALHAQYKSSGLDASLLTRLTDRERETLQLMGKRLSNRQIANELGIRLGTVKSHVHNVLKKLQVGSREEAAAYLLLEPEADAEGTRPDGDGPMRI
jgi:DNA-binding NarL/FixJ family response regulator